jgi:hypothetical protein
MFRFMASPITFTTILENNSVHTSTVYKMTIQAIEFERLKLQTHERNYDADGYARSLKLIFEYQRILAIIRGDTLDRISGKI